MIIDLHKCVPIHRLTFNFKIPQHTVYFLFNVTPETQRYNLVNGQFWKHHNGRYVFDKYDIFEQTPRVLKYIGETVAPAKRIWEHYFAEDYRIEMGGATGPVFNYVRMFKPKKRFTYDNVRIVEETKLIQKFLPDVNTSCQLSDKYKAIILNSEGKVTPQQLFPPHVIHARDVYKAYQAWLNEDQNYIDTELTPADKNWEFGNSSKLRPISFFDKKGNKLKFGRFFKKAVIGRHKKQREIMKNHHKNLVLWTKEYAPEFYEERQRSRSEYGKKWYRRKQKIKGMMDLFEQDEYNNLDAQE